MDSFLERHRLVHDGGFPEFEELYCNLNMANSTEISYCLSFKAQSTKSQSLKAIQTL